MHTGAQAPGILGAHYCHSIESVCLRSTMHQMIVSREFSFTGGTVKNLYFYLSLAPAPALPGIPRGFYLLGWPPRSAAVTRDDLVQQAFKRILSVHPPGQKYTTISLGVPEFVRGYTPGISLRPLVWESSRNKVLGIMLVIMSAYLMAELAPGRKPNSAVP